MYSPISKNEIAVAVDDGERQGLDQETKHV
jgi:hypothetical protein